MYIDFDLLHFNLSRIVPYFFTTFSSNEIFDFLIKNGLDLKRTDWDSIKLTNLTLIRYLVSVFLIYSIVLLMKIK
jgi:hypothetical protein